MSGTASRNQTRLTYAPGLRVGSYPGGAMASAPPVQGGAQGPLPVPPVSSAPQASAPPVFVGSGVPAQRMREPWEMGGSGSEGGSVADAGAAVGSPSTGSFLSDVAGFGRVAGPAVAGMLSGPLGVMGLAAGLMGMGVANAFGAKETALGIGDALGIDGRDGGMKGEAAPGTMGAPAMGFGPQEGVKPDALQGGDPGMGGSMDANGNPSDGSGGMGGDTGGGTASGAGSDANGNPDGGGDFMRGGYTGMGRDGVIQADQRAGTVHEGEVVIPASAVQQYGLAPLLMLARGQVEPSRLMALLRG